MVDGGPVPDPFMGRPVHPRGGPHPCDLVGTSQWQPPGSDSARSYRFLVLSGLATSGSWVCYFRALKLGDAARVAPIDKLPALAKAA